VFRQNNSRIERAVSRQNKSRIERAVSRQNNWGWTGNFTGDWELCKRRSMMRTEVIVWEEIFEKVPRHVSVT